MSTNKARQGMTPEQELEHLRAENERLAQRVRALEKGKEPANIRRQAQRQGLDQACVRLVQVADNPQYPSPHTPKVAWAEAWHAGCWEAINRITDEIDELNDRPEQQTLEGNAA